MARFGIENYEAGDIGANATADIYCEMGLMYATGRDCDMDLIAAHKWFNIAAIKGSSRAVALRNEITATMSKSDLAAALRSARQWMTDQGLGPKKKRCDCDGYETAAV